MDVFLIPTGGDQYALYCEIASPPVEDAQPTSIWGKVVQTFRRAVAEGEEERARPGGGDVQHSRFRRAITRRLAEAVAEQRLLWHLRRESAARLIHPDDLTPERAGEHSRALLVADYAKHRNWCVIDGLITVGSAALILVPGPNVLGYYFLFRAVGHFLSMRGANQGLSVATWTHVPSAPLTELRGVLPLPGDERGRRVESISEALGLEHLPRFVGETAPL